MHQSDREAILELTRRGTPVSIITGRMYSGTREIAKGLELEGPVGCVDGAHIVEAGTDRDLLQHTIVPEATDSLFELLREWESTTFVFADDAVFHDERGAAFLPYVGTWSRRYHRLDSVVDHPGWGGEERIAALVTLGSEQQIALAEERIRAEHSEHLQAIAFQVRRGDFDGIWGMVVRSAGVSKGTALEWIARHHGVSPAEVVAVGDWLNDIPLLEAAGRSFAMAQAPGEVKAAASDQLEADTWSGGGIREAAERAGLL